MNDVPYYATPKLIKSKALVIPIKSCLSLLFLAYPIATIIFNTDPILDKIFVLSFVLFIIIKILCGGSIHLNVHFTFEFAFAIYCVMQTILIPLDYKTSALMVSLKNGLTVTFFLILYNLVTRFAVLNLFLKSYMIGSLVACSAILINNMDIILKGNRRLNSATANYEFLLGYAIGPVATAIALCAAIGYFLCLYLYFNKDNKRFSIYSFLFLGVIVLSGTRKILLFVFIITLFAFIARTPQNWLVKVVPFSIALFCIYIIIMEIPLVYDILGRRINNTISILMGQAGLQEDASMFDRAILIDLAQYYWAKRPIFGQGAAIFGKYLNVGFARYSNLHPHNNFWEILCSTGIIGFVLYYAKYVYLLWKTLSLYFENRKNNRDSIMFAGLIIALLSIEWWQRIYVHRMFTIVFLFVSLYLQQANPQRKNA